MSTNILTRLRSLLPQPPLLVGKVIEHHDDDTSTVELPIGIGLSAYAAGVTTGSLIRARGRTVAVGLNAFVRAGVVESQAPDGEPLEVIVGRVVSNPFGPTGLQFSGTVPAQAATVGVAYSLLLAPYFTQFYAPVGFALTAGVLPTGLTLNTGTGAISGTPSGAGVAAGLVVTAQDTTGRTAATNAFAITVGV